MISSGYNPNLNAFGFVRSVSYIGWYFGIEKLRKSKISSGRKSSQKKGVIKQKRDPYSVWAVGLGTLTQTDVLEKCKQKLAKPSMLFKGRENK